MRLRRNRQGVVLIFALWVLGVLAILAVSVAAGIRERIFLVARLDERSRMTNLLESAVKKAAGYVHQQMEESSFGLTPQSKMNLFNNTNELSMIALNNDQAGVGYVPPGDSGVRWGVVDEESKINLNKVKIPVLIALLSNVLSLREEDASKLAMALLDWRQFGEGEVTGFFSEDRYANLQYPYPKKNAPYETLDEWLLVPGMNKKMYEKLLDYVTIYGDGGININTASKPVLMALGLPESLVDKIFNVRRGKDGLDATGDDHVFVQPYDITAEINAILPLQLPEAQAIDKLTMSGVLVTNSYFYTVQVTAKLADRTTPGRVRAVYAARADKIIYWKER